jgi:capsular exopolysaccharide synthesis family protein
VNQFNGQHERVQTAPLANFLRILRRRWIVVALAMTLVPATAAAYALSRPDEYSAGSSLLFRSTVGSGALAQQDEERAAATNASLASLRRVSERTADAIGSGLTGGAVAKAVSVKPTTSDANVLEVKAKTGDPELARRIANTYAEEFVAFRRNSDRRRARESLNTARSRIRSIDGQLTRLEDEAAPEGSDAAERQADQRRSLEETRNQLEDNAKDLDAEVTLATGNVEVVERADSALAVNPKPIQTGILALGFGALIGIGLALLFETLDRRLRDPKEIEAILRRPTLGAIPLSPAFARNGGRPSRRMRGLRTSDMEAFHMLRANLRYIDFDKSVKSVVVTSAAPGEGKSTVAWNLAASGANAGLRTLLIEAELRRPTLVREFNMPDGPGLSDILVGDADEAAVVQRFAVSARADGDSAAAMDVIVAGRRVPNPADLLDSGRMEALIRKAEEDYELVVIDTPPVSVVSDPIPLLACAGGVIIVSRLGQTTRDAAQHLQTQLEGLNARVLGVVINGITAQEGFYGSVYEYADRYGPGPQG